MNDFGSYVRPPFECPGSKRSVSGKIIPLFPKDTDTFYDLFGGSFFIGVNAPCKRLVYNDLCPQMSGLFLEMYQTEKEKFLLSVNAYRMNFNLSETGKTEYYTAREFYNREPNPRLLFVLLCHCFKKRAGFNANHEFTQPFGARCFDTDAEREAKRFLDALHDKELTVRNMDFAKVPLRVKKGDSFVYCDPPYPDELSMGNPKWTKDEQKRLLKYLNTLTKFKVRWGLLEDLRYEPFLPGVFTDRYVTFHVSGGSCVYITNWTEDGGLSDG